MKGVSGLKEQHKQKHRAKMVCQQQIDSSDYGETAL